MSDGPHRSLKMSRKWKRVADWIYNEAYSVEQRCEALSAATEEDWRQQIPKGFLSTVRGVLANGQKELFCDQTAQDLEELRAQTPGYPHASTFLDYVIQAAHTRGTLAEDAFLIAARKVVTEFAERGLRQVEEHHLRESPHSSVVHIRQRAQEALGRFDTKAIACHLQGFERSEHQQVSLKPTGLDEGVPI